MRVGLGIGLWMLTGGAGYACSPIELDACAVSQPVDAGLLAPFEAICPEGLHIEEFAVTAGTAWVGLRAEVWVLDPAQMTCKGAAVCAGEACAPMLSMRKAGCEGGAACWTREVRREELVPAP